ncbi:MAG TPA: MurR/RpiR family transcriptional regulator [Ilumatobacteraceae bacterium]|nr:MurR/RpiR family transcriptional regulator [Ilumatobacteraceae bacterium]
MDLEQRLAERATSLTPSERRLGETVLADPNLVAFGTVADVAEAARTGTATVVRFAVKLGFDGYSQLQASVQREVSGQLRPAVERIRDQRADDDTLAARHADVEAANVRTTLDALRAGDGRVVVERLADDSAPVLVLSGVASRGVALQFVADLDQLRPGVLLLDGTQVDVVRMLALTAPGATLLVLDLRRYERWLIDALAAARDRGAWTVAITDSVLSPLATAAERSFVVAAASTGPFDSHVGTLALLNLFVVEVAAARRELAAERLEAIEDAWGAADALTDDGK